MVIVIAIAVNVMLGYLILRTLYRNRRFVGVLLILGMVGLVDLVIKAYQHGAFE